MTIAHALTTTLAVSLLIIIVLAVRGSVARRFGANAAYALWLIPAFRLLMPPLPSWLAPLSPFGVAQADTGRASMPADTLTPSALPSTEPLAASTPLADPAWTSDTVGDSIMGLVPTRIPSPASVPSPEAFEADPSPTMVADMASPVLSANTVPMIAMVILIAGAVLFYAWTLYRQARFSWLVAMESSPASPDLIQRAEDIRRQLGLRRTVAVRTSFLPSSPLVMGVLRPTVIVPAWFELDYTETEQRLALTHELAHVKRGDLLALNAAHLLLALQWFNPLAHLAVRAFRADQEAACDAHVLTRSQTSPHAYGATLLKSVKLMRPAPQLHAAGLTLDHGLKERFERMGQPAPSARAMRLGTVSAAAVGALLIFASATAVADDDGAGENDLLGGSEDTSVSITITEHKVDGHHRHRHVHTVQTGGRERLIMSEDPFADMHRQLEKIEHLQKDLMPITPGTPPQPPKPPVPPPAQSGSLNLNLDLDLSQLEALGDLETLEQLGELAALEAIEELAALSGDHFQIMVDETGNVMSITSDGLNLSVSGFDEAAFEASMEAFEVQMAAFEVEMEAFAERVEAEAERYADRIEARVEAIVDSPRFEKAAEDGETVVETLSEACHDNLKSGLRASLVTATAPHSGKTYQAVCMDDTNPLSDAEYAAFLENHDDLSDEQCDDLKDAR